MVFSGRNIYRLVLVLTIIIVFGAGLILTGLNSHQLEVKQVPVLTKAPKAKLIPAASTKKIKADISNAPINSSVKKPIIFKI